MKMKVGNDEFCIKCMKWQEYDDGGKCKICGSIIQKLKKSNNEIGSSNDYDIESDSFDHDHDEDNIDEY